MRDVEITGTTEPDEIAVVIALLCRGTAAVSAPPDGLAAWREVRRAAQVPHRGGQPQVRRPGTTSRR
jgi:hypothetical protein